MSAARNKPTARHKIIIGIDYGTTFSGVSYVTTDKSDIEDVNIISSWPGQNHAMWKAPTRIAYARNNPQLQSNKWGFEVSSKHISYSWTKLLLDGNARAGEHDDPALTKMSGSGMLQLPPFRNAAGVCEDFLREVYTFVSTKLRDQMTDLTFASTPMECWISLPAIWSDEAKHATLIAAKKAGFGNRIGDKVWTIAEPEAAAIATLKIYSGPTSMNPIKVKEDILICDCGGGTVDITTYTIAKIQPHLEFDELHIGAGGKCGATYIDRNLHTLLSDRFGQKFDTLSAHQTGPGSKLMESFEKHKRDFGRTEDKETLEIGPIRLDVEDSKFYEEEERMIKLSFDDMDKLFEPVMLDIVSLVKNQIELAARKKKIKIDRLILVGGFAESPHLRKVLGKWCKQYWNIIFLCPDYPQTAIVRGAALRGLENIAPGRKFVRRHYGSTFNMPFREGVDPEDKSYICNMDGKKTCSDRVVWQVSKGDEILQGMSKTFDYIAMFELGQPINCSLHLVSSSLLDAPDYCTDPRVDANGSIRVVLPALGDYGEAVEQRYSQKLGRIVHIINCEIRVTFGGKGSNLIFECLVNEKVVGNAIIEFGKKKQG